MATQKSLPRAHDPRKAATQALRGRVEVVTMRINKALVDLSTIKRQDEDVKFYVPDISSAPVKKLVAIYHATNGRLVFIDQDQLRRYYNGNA